VLNCKWVQDRDIIICFQQHTKNAIFEWTVCKAITVTIWCSKCPPTAFTHSHSRVRHW